MVIWGWEWEDDIAHAADADENVTDLSETDMRLKQISVMKDISKERMVMKMIQMLQIAV